MDGRHHITHTLIATLCTLALGVAVASAVSTVPLEGGVRGQQGTGLTSSSPGTSFTFDYRALVADDTAPYDAARFNLLFDAAHVQFTELKIQLDSAPTVFTFFPFTGNNYQSNYVIYDPAYETDPGQPWPATPAWLVMPQVWKDDLSDGVLSGKFWVTNPSSTPNQYFLSTSAFFVVPEAAAPEPTAGFAIGVTAATLLRHRRGR